MEKETREERFRRVAEKRVQNILKSVRSLSQCANPRVYEWNEKQLKKIWEAVDREIDLCKQSFRDPESRTFRL